VVLRITVPVSEGDVLTFAPLVGATATHAYTGTPEATPIGSPIAVTAASGHVDFGNTGVLRIYVPDGLSLSGANAPASTIVVSTPVPEPGALALAFAGGLGMLWRGHRRRSA
jgi:PEP-CTERM motif